MMERWKKIILVNIAITLLLVFVMEAISSIAWYQKHKSDNGSISSTVHVIGRLLWKFRSIPRIQEQHSEFAKLEKVIELRENGVETYPAYLFDPQLHVDFPIYHLAHPASSTIVYCNENGFWATFETDEIGFRNPKGQLEKDIDFVFIGDSYTEGACTKDKDTFAGVFRESGFTVLNLGRGGAGPLFQLATLREYGASVKPKTIVWFVFTGNDLKNLREEKVTRLFSYIENGDYSQNLLSKKHEISEQLKMFLEREIELSQERRILSLPNPFYHAYGETLDKIEAEQKEVILLKKVAEEILRVSNRIGARLFIVLINHPDYDHTIQDITSTSILDFANEMGTDYFVLHRQQLASRKEFLYSNNRTHLSPNGYRFIAGKVLETLTNRHLTKPTGRPPEATLVPRSALGGG